MNKNKNESGSFSITCFATIHPILPDGMRPLTCAVTAPGVPMPEAAALFAAIISTARQGLQELLKEAESSGEGEAARAAVRYVAGAVVTESTLRLGLEPGVDD